MILRISLLLCFCSTNFFSYSQNLFSPELSYKYAKNLTCRTLHNEAEKSLIPFLNIEQPDSFLTLYFHNLYLQNKLNELFSIIRKITKQESIREDVLNQIASICIEKDSSHLLTPVYNNLPIDLQARILAINEQNDSLKLLIEKHPNLIDTSYFTNVLENLSRTQSKYKKPNKYIMASIIIPGSGKMLLGNSYEGFWHSFIIASHVYLSVYSFNKSGILSAFAWINTGMAISFYGANIWGNKTSFNRKKNLELKKIKNELKQNLYSSYFGFNCAE